MPAASQQPSLPETRLPSATDRLRLLIEGRCARFSQQQPFDTERLAFTHVQKMGGSSIKVLLDREGRIAGKKSAHLVNQVRSDASHHVSTTMLTLRQLAAAAQLVNGWHFNAAWLESPAAVGWRGGNFTLVTILRNPIDTLQSKFRFNGGQPSLRIKAVYASHMSLQQAYDGWVQGLCEGKGGPSFRPDNHNFAGAPRRAGNRTRGGPGQPKCVQFSQALAQHAPPAVFSRNGSTQWTSPGCYRCNPSGNEEHASKEAVFQNLVQRFSVVGILERRNETLEVMRCRVPWVHAQAFPHENPTKPFPVHLQNDAELMHQITADDAELVSLANRVLSADVACCRKLQHASH